MKASRSFHHIICLWLGADSGGSDSLLRWTQL